MSRPKPAPKNDGAGNVERPAVRGWEKNTAGKVAPRLADLGAMMDPERYRFLVSDTSSCSHNLVNRLAAQSTDLNLKLMRWRLLPELDLERVRDLKVLILGAGTLGCYFARGIMVSDFIFVIQVIIKSEVLGMGSSEYYTS